MLFIVVKNCEKIKYPLTKTINLSNLSNNIYLKIKIRRARKNNHFYDKITNSL